ncbi:unnamed protein product, partial [Fusarium fujikuroi]
MGGRPTHRSRHTEGAERANPASTPEQQPVLLHGSEAWYLGNPRPRYQRQTENVFRTRLRRADELLAPCPRPKLIQRCFRQEEIAPLQTASKEKTTSAFLYWLQSLGPLTLARHSRYGGQPPLLSSTSDSISRRPQAVRRSSRFHVQPCTIFSQRGPSIDSSNITDDLTNIIIQESRPMSELDTARNERLWKPSFLL